MKGIVLLISCSHLFTDFMIAGNPLVKKTMMYTA